MSKTWIRFKNWLIKKLGGYTKAEFSDMTRVQISHTGLALRRDTGKIVTLSADMSIDTIHPVSREWIEGTLLVELLEQMKPFVEWESTEDHVKWPQKSVRARIRVVNRNG